MTLSQPDIVALRKAGDPEKALARCAEARAEIGDRPWIFVEELSCLFDLNRHDEIIGRVEAATPSLQWHPNVRLIHARALAETGDRDRALSECRQALNDRPDMAPAYYYATRLLLEDGRNAEAIEVAQAGLRACPGDLTLMQRKFAALRGDGHLDAAAKAAADVTARHPDFGPGWLMRIRHDRSRQRSASALDLLAEAAAAVGDVPDIARHLLIEEVGCLIDLRRFSDAQARLEAAPPEFSQTPQGRFFWARIMAETGQTQAALSLCEELIDDAPEAPHSRHVMLRVLLDTGQIRRAIRVAKAGLLLQPNHPGLSLALATALQADGQIDTAIERVSRIAAERPDLLEAWTLWARFERDRGAFDAAADVLRNATARFPGNLNLTRHRVAIARDAGALEDAFRLCWAQPDAAPDLSDPKARLGVVPDLPVEALAIAIERPGLPIAKALLSVVLQQIDQIEIEHLPTIAGQAEMLGDEGGAAQAYRALFARETWPIHTAIAVVRRAHALDQSGIMTALLAKIRGRVAAAERTVFDYRAARIQAGPEKALAMARRGVTGIVRRNKPQAMDLAQLLAASGHTALAIRYLRRCLRAWPTHAPFFHLLIRQNVELSAFDTASEWLDRWHGHSPPADARLLRHHVLTMAGRRDDAMAMVVDEMSKPRFDLPLQPSLFHAICQGDLEHAERLAMLMRDQPRINQAASHHFGTSHAGSLVNDLRLLHRSLGRRGRAALAAGRIAPEVAETYFSAAARVLDGVGDDAVPPASDAPMMPQRIIQYWDTVKAPPEVENLMQGWAETPGHEYMRLNAQTARRWLLQTYGPGHVRAFRAAHNPAEGSDFLRLCVLYAVGGIYMDADNKRDGDIEAMRRKAGSLVLFREPFGAIANDVILAAPKNPVIGMAMERARAALLSGDTESTWIKTGPGLLARVVAFAILSNENEATEGLQLRPQHALREVCFPRMELPYKSTARYWNDRVGRAPRQIAKVLEALATGARAAPERQPAMYQ